MNHLPYHKKNIITEQAVAKSVLKPGAIIMFRYMNEKKEMSKPMVMVLNPHWQGHLHGFKLDEMPVRVLQKMVEHINVWYSRKLNELMSLRLPLVKVNVGPPKAFYHTHLKPIMRGGLKKADPYREYKLNRITNLTLIEYRFDLVEKVREKAEKKRQREIQQLIIQRKKLERSKS